MHSERLDYLYLLTINDIRATNPSLWNGWKHQLLKELYSKTRLKINKEPIQTSNEISIERKRHIIKQIDESKRKMIKNYLSLFDNSYFNKNSTDSLQWQVELYTSYPDQDLIIECRKIFQNLVEIFIKAQNTDGLFYRLTKALEESGLDVIDANIFTSNDESFAANTFIFAARRIQDNIEAAPNPEAAQNFIDFVGTTDPSMTPTPLGIAFLAIVSLMIVTLIWVPRNN